jgi:signal transduction histidine kinase
MSDNRNRRILVIDDQPAIHEDFRKILSAGECRNDLVELEETLFGEVARSERGVCFEIDSAFQGQEGLARAERAIREGRPHALAFVDLRMPPGWDGIETAVRIWEMCPELQVVICTAYSDYSWREMMSRLGATDRWVILKKPFDNIEVLQLACALTEKWSLNLQARLKLSELDAMVADRTRQLCISHERLMQAAEQRLHMEQQLLQARKLESVGQLAAGVAHHFNNLLQVIVGNCQWVLSEGPLTPDQREALREIEAGSTRAAGLTRRLIAFSSGQLMRMKPVGLNTIVAEVANRLRFELPESIAIKFLPASELPRVSADPSSLGQVLTILASNAKDAMKQRGELTFRTEKVDLSDPEPDDPTGSGSGTYVCLSVSDTGTGMDEETVQHLFEPFFTTKGFTEGVGLGLATAYGIVKQHRGWFKVASRVNAGTTFRVYLPAFAGDCDHSGDPVPQLAPAPPLDDSQDMRAS